MLSVVFVVLSYASTIAQDCVPDQNITESGFHPKQVDPAIAGQEYKQVLQIRVFKDTTVVINGNTIKATIDSIRVNDILGLPTGFYYTCSRKNCSYIPDSTGCATLHGNPKESDIGDYPLKIAIQTFGKVAGFNTSQKDTLEQFMVQVSKFGFVENQYSQIQGLLYPNPSSNGIFFLKPGFESSIQRILISNIEGVLIEDLEVSGIVDLQHLSSGMYLYRVQLNNGRFSSGKLSITH